MYVLKEAGTHSPARKVQFNVQTKGFERKLREFYIQSSSACSSTMTQCHKNVLLNSNSEPEKPESDIAVAERKGTRVDALRGILESNLRKSCACRPRRFVIS